MRDLPSGTVTFLFTDVEGSTKLLHELGAEGYAAALAEHRSVLRDAFTRHGGVEVDTQGDAFFVAFPTAAGAIAAAQEAQAALSVPVRMGIHTGTPHVTGEGYVGPDVNKAARIAAAGHGGQVLVSAETRALVEAEVLALGEHRVKDFEQPLAVFQLGSEHFPPLKTISNTNLPRPASSFVGRDKEVEEVASLLQDGARLLTLTGPGGTGKTRLALAAAGELVPQFKAGVFWVGLATLRDPALVTDTIAHTLGAKDGLAEHIGEREMLLLLDNLEQVVEAAPELAALVEACPNLRLLVTSRELLRVRGEREYRVAPLAEREAVALFCERSRLDRDETIAELCSALDNLPLALELAAARASVLSPSKILERLSQRLDLLKGGRDADPRQQTLRAAIEWSYELLSQQEKQLFARLAVFRGGCTLEAAEEVAEADLDVLQSLVDKSLLRHTDERFWMLETIREYALERLAESREAETLSRRHADYFLALAEEAHRHVIHEESTEHAQWLDRLEREHDNVRAVLDRFEASDDTQLAVRLAGALAYFWIIRGHTVEGRRRLETVLGKDGGPTQARAIALTGAAELALTVGDVGAATPWAREALVISRRLGDAWGVAAALQKLGYVAIEEGDLSTARQLLEESVRGFRDVGDEHDALWTARTLGWSYHEDGDLERARVLHEESLRRARQLGNRPLEAALLGSLATIALDQGRVDDGVSLLRENVPIWRDLGDRHELASALCRVARALAFAGRATTSARLLSWSERLLDDMGGTERWIRTRNDETLTALRTQLPEEAFAEAWAQGQNLTTDGAVALALDSLE